MPYLIYYQSKTCVNLESWKPQLSFPCTVQTCKRSSSATVIVLPFAFKFLLFITSSASINFIFFRLSNTGSTRIISLLTNEFSCLWKPWMISFIWGLPYGPLYCHLTGYHFLEKKRMSKRAFKKGWVLFCIPLFQQFLQAMN